MDKSSRARRGKARALPPPGDFIALGAKAPRATESEMKPLPPLKVSQASGVKKPSLSVALGERRRELSIPGGPLSKRPKLSSPPSSPFASRVGEGEVSKKVIGSPLTPTQLTAVEVHPSELENAINEAEATGNKPRIDALLCGSIKSLKLNRAKPDPASYLTLVYLSKIKPDIFTSKRVAEALVGVLKRDVTLNIKGNKSNLIVPIAVCNILLSAYCDEEDWPESFVKVFVDDALSDRLWVDNEYCQKFVENIQTAFGTLLPARTTPQPESGPKQTTEQTASTTSSSTIPSASSTASTATTDIQASVSTVLEEDVFMDTSSPVNKDNSSVLQRYTDPVVEESIQSYVIELVREQLTRRQPLDNISRNLLRLLTVTCGFRDIRVLVSHRLEMWITNPKLTRQAQELLMAVCMNCTSHCNEDIETISHLVRMRLKTKPMANHYILCIRELLGQHSDNMSTVLKHVVYNELSTQSRNPNNMTILGAIFQYNPKKAAKYLAIVFQDLLANKDDFLRAVRALLREILRSLRHDIDFVALCRGFMQERTDPVVDAGLKERLLSALTDLISMSTFLSVSPSVKEVAAANSKGEKKDLSVLHEFQKQISVIQRDAVWWLHTIVHKMYSPTNAEFKQSLQKVLFLESVDSYTERDNWPPENDRVLLMSCVTEVPVLEDTLMRLLVIGLNAELPLTSPEALEIAEKLIRRAASVKTGVTVLEVKRLELIDAVLNLCAYRHPKDIQLPAGYVPPTLAILNLYWKGWLMLLVLAAFNPQSVGQTVWENYPTLKCFMEMIMTNNFSFPPPTFANNSEEMEQMKSNELQLCCAEKEDILEFEGYLAAATTGVTITESNSLLISQLMTMDPTGPARKPPQQITDQLKTINKLYGLGQLLCRSRSPDFLLDIIQRQGATQSMPWLAELVQSSEGSLDVLPVQCLCEFLLLEKPQEKERQEKDGHEKAKKRLAIQRRVLCRLQALLYSKEASAESTCEVLEYFMRRLSSSSIKTKERNSALKGLELVLSKPCLTPRRSVGDGDVVVLSESDPSSMIVEDEFSSEQELSQLHRTHKWLLCNMPALPHFKAVCSTVCYGLRQACHVEVSPSRLQAYLVFLSEHGKDADKTNSTLLAHDIAQMIIDRPTMMKSVLESDQSDGEETYQSLLDLFTKNIILAMDAEEQTFTWEDTQDHLFVQWSEDSAHSNKAATIHSLIINACIVLLTHGKPQGDQNTYELLLSMWCPSTGHVKAFLTDTGEEAMLFREWLRLHMIRSEEPRLVKTALEGLMPAQLVLFCQSFGIPVKSMSYLLHYLDEAAKDDPVGMDQAVVDKAYMLQLIEVQKMRGASGGEIVCQLLEQPTPAEYDSNQADGRISPMMLTPLPGHMTVDSKTDGDEEMQAVLSLEERLLMVYDVISPVKNESTQDKNQLAREIQKELSKNVVAVSKNEKSSNGFAREITSTIIKVLRSDQGQQFGTKLFEKSNLSCSILRLLMTRHIVLKRHEKSSGLADLLRCLSKFTRFGGSLGSLIKCYKTQLGVTDERIAESVSEIINKLSTETSASKQTLLVKQFALKTQEKNANQQLDTTQLVRAFHNLKCSNCPLYEEFIQAAFTLLTRNDQAAAFLPGSPAWKTSHHQRLKTCLEIIKRLLSKTKEPNPSIDTAARRIFFDDNENSSTPLPDKESVEQDSTNKTECDAGTANDHMTSGLFIDWFELIDPEMVNTDPLVQRQLLFQDRSHFGSNRRPFLYLLSLLTHQTSWSTLQDCLDWLLCQSPQGMARIDPSIALDFIWTCFHVPRLWQGRPQQKPTELQKKGKEYEQSVLNLTDSQIASVVDYILQEVSKSVHVLAQEKGWNVVDFFHTGSADDSCKDKLQKIVVPSLSRRLPLVLSCCHGDKRHLHKVVQQLQMENLRVPKFIQQQFLVQLYMAVPELILWLSDSEGLLTTGPFTSATFSQLDVICHRSLTSLADSKPGKAQEEKLLHCNILCRKLAVLHPKLLLRHLAMIGALLQGRTHLQAKEFRNQNHFLFFTHVLGLIDLLRPHIFEKHKDIQNGLQLVLEPFFDLIQSECLQGSECLGIVPKFVEFLHHFATLNSTDALRILQYHAYALKDLIHDFPDLGTLKSLLAAISLPLDPVHIPLSGDDTLSPDQPQGDPVSAAVPTILLSPVLTPWKTADLAPFIHRLAPHQPPEEVLKVLSDLDETSRRRVDILQHFVLDLRRLVVTSHSACRTKAHKLLLRHIKQNPSVSGHFLDTYLQCLDDENHDVVTTAAVNIPEYAVLCSEQASLLLQKLFSLVMYKHLDLAENLLKTIRLLNIGSS